MLGACTPAKSAGNEWIRHFPRSVENIEAITEPNTTRRRNEAVRSQIPYKRRNGFLATSSVIELWIRPAKRRRQMTKFRSVGWTIGAAFGIVVLIVLIIVYLVGFTNFRPTEAILGLTIVLGLSVLVLMLFIMAAGFKVLGLDDSNQAVGLPAGTIRAMIALLLILIWAIVSIFLFTSIVPLNSTTNADSIKLGQQFYTTMSTLVVAISAFYFGSSSVRSALSAVAASSSTAITDIVPEMGKENQEIALSIIGRNFFQTPDAVRLALDSNNVISATEIALKKTERIDCKIAIPANQTQGVYDLVVVMNGTEYRLPKAFKVTA
jgi:hypothetical protein